MISDLKTSYTESLSVGSTLVNDSGMITMHRSYTEVTGHLRKSSLPIFKIYRRPPAVFSQMQYMREMFTQQYKMNTITAK